MGVHVTPAETKRDRNEFLSLPRKIYTDMPGFVAPLDLERRSMLDPKAAAFFHHGRACYFLARQNGRLVGRISAQVDPLAVTQWGAPIGLFGALDAVDDEEVIGALFSAACAWLQGEGMTHARGPYLLSANGESGLMISGQTERPMIMMPWHPPYLARHIEALGWTKAMDLLTYEVAVGNSLEAAHPVPTMRLNSDGMGHLTVRQMRPRHIAEDGEILRTLYNDAWSDNWGFVPLTTHEMTSMIKEMKPILRPDYYVLVERDGVPVAVALLVPNLFDLMADLGGAPSPIGWVKLVWRLLNKRFRSGRVILLGISATVRHTTLGAMLPSLIIKELMHRAPSMTIKTAELGWILETNSSMRRIIEKFASEPNKRYRLYEKEL
jgi:hypothetical protein|nr:hypothetical protein [Acidisoma sp. PAMC 29798]